MRRRGSGRPSVVDLFAGAGLFSFAFASEGFEVIRAIELDPVAASTYARNVGQHVEVANVSTVHRTGKCDVLIAGPPCQGFSTLGRMDQQDLRSQLSLCVVHWAKVLKPKLVVIENVAAFLSSPVWGRVSKGLLRCGYEVGACVLNAYEFGVAQLRQRSFTFASRIGLPVVNRPRVEVEQTVRQAWIGLSRKPDGRYQHYSPKPSPIALARMRFIPPGGDKRDVMRRAPHLAAPSWWSLNCEVTDVWGRMEWDKPSNTLRTAIQNASKGRYIHPDQHRVISLREAARLHSIPDAWEFSGLPTQIARQIGNSVPPALGRAVARAVARILY